MRSLIAVVTATLIVGCQASPSPSPSAGGVVATSRSRSSPVTATIQPTTTPPTPTETAPSTSARWEQIADLEAFHGLQLVEVTWTGARFVASSGDFMLDSPDGRTWHRGQPIRSFGFPEFAVGPGGTVAVSDDTSWFSADGLAWTPARRTKHSAPRTAASWPWQGWSRPTTGGSRSARTARMLLRLRPRWLRPRGLALGRRDHLGPRSDHGPRRRGKVYRRRAHRQRICRRWRRGGGTKDPRRGLVVGRRRDLEPVPDSTVFGAPPDVAPRWVGMTDVVAASDVVVAVGQAFTQDVGGSALAWYSIDGGATWQRAVGERFVGGQLFAAAAIPSGFVATGPSGRTSCWGGIWLSSDGASWDCVAEDRSFNKFAAYAGAASPTTLVVVGSGGAERNLDATVWVHEVSSLEALP